MRGRWKNSTRQHDTYADTVIPYVDAKVAAALCKGGVITYQVIKESGITDGWIMDHVVPNMARFGISREVCLVLGRAMLWRIFDNSGDDLVPVEQKNRILARYRDLRDRNSLPEDSNPVKKVPLVVDGFDAEVLIETIEDADEEDGGGVNGSATIQRMGLRRQEIRLLASQVHHLRRQLAEQQAENERRFEVRTLH